MSDINNTAELLDYLAKKVECMYISDLRHPAYLSVVQEIIKKIQPDDFTVSQWNDTVSYLARENLEFQSREMAIEYILKMG